MAEQATEHLAQDLNENQLEFYLAIAKQGSFTGRLCTAFGRMIKVSSLIGGGASTTVETINNGLGSGSTNAIAGAAALALVGHGLDKFGERATTLHTTTKQYLEREQYVRSHEQYMELTSGDDLPSSDPFAKFFEQNPIDTTVLE